MIKILLRWVVTIVVIVAILFFSLFSSVDDDPIEEKDFYKETLAQLDTLTFAGKKPITKTQAAWFKVNITPATAMPMAGYAPRDHFDAVHDSVFVRGLVISNGSLRCYFISADLLIFPPSLREKIVSRYSPANAIYYLMASHAHSSLGTWDNSLVGNLILGSYQDEYWNSIADKIVTQLKAAEQQLLDARLYYLEPDAKEYTENRIDPTNGAVDGKVRSIKVIRKDSSKAIWMTFSAHPTNISHLSLTLSGDYPNALVKRAEQDFDFAMFGSGMVGSHRVKGLEKREFELCDELAGKLYDKIQNAQTTALGDSLAMSIRSIPLGYGKSQMHVLQKYAVRNWAFNGLLRPLEGNLTYCRLGPIIFLGMPCDFSGEIFTEEKLGELAGSQGENLMITSFNGNYTGYISFDKHYGHTEQEEVMALNWVGPHFGKYYTDVIRKIVEKSK